MIPKRMIVSCLVGVLAAGCGHGKLVPDKNANVIAGAETAAVATVSGVRCSANGEAWRGLPRDLDTEATPIKVRIKNDSGTPISLLYERFALIGSSGTRYHPRPLVHLADDGVTNARSQLVRPIYAAEKFHVARRLSDVYRTLSPWPTPLVRNDASYDHELSKWDGDLPTFDMLTQGLPEGVLESGGTITGFLYFGPEARREDGLVFNADLTAGDQGEEVALISIPFRVE